MTWFLFWLLLVLLFIAGPGPGLVNATRCLLSGCAEVTLGDYRSCSRCRRVW